MASFTGILKKLSKLNPVTELAVGVVDVIADLVKEDPDDVKAALEHDPTDEGMDFGEAIEALKAGKMIARSGWNGKGMWLTIQSSQFYPDSLPDCFDPDSSELIGDTVLLKTPLGEFRAWNASQEDMLAEDWEIVI